MAISETVSSSLWVLQCSGQLLTLPRGKMEGCVCVCWRKRSKWQEERHSPLSTLPSQPHLSPAILTPFSFSTPPSMCCWRIKLINRVPNRVPRERVCIHTRICIRTQSLTKTSIQAHTIGKKEAGNMRTCTHTYKDVHHNMHKLQYEIEFYMCGNEGHHILQLWSLYDSIYGPLYGPLSCTVNKLKIPLSGFP